MEQLFFLCIFAFLAGFIDSIVGGGGLIQLPALLVFLPNTAVPLIFGTNKLSSIAGTSAAAIHYSQQVKIDWSIVLISTVSAFTFSFIGASTVSIINPTLMRPLVFLLLILVAIYTWLKKILALRILSKFKEASKVYMRQLLGHPSAFMMVFLGQEQVVF